MGVYDDFIQSLREQQDDMLAQIDWLHSVGVTVYINGEDVTEEQLARERSNAENLTQLIRSLETKNA